MKVIFIKDVPGQGKKGEIKEVKAGYGQNYLIKNGYAVLATKLGFERLEQEKRELEKIEIEELKKAKELKKELEKVKLIFYVKTGEQNKVFGSISPKQIAMKLKDQGFEIDRKKIIIKKQLSTLGNHSILIEIHKQVIATIKVSLEVES